MDVFFVITGLLGYGLSQSAGFLALVLALMMLAGLSLRLSCRVVGSSAPSFESSMSAGYWAVALSGVVWRLLGALGFPDWTYLFLLVIVSLVYCVKLEIEFPSALVLTTVQFALITAALLLFGALIYSTISARG